ncbi:MAG: hypothetical protein NC402_01000 [Prevotella sp.]|nr:hypothetical protein [Prevotella sp.]MCM1074384.1 hypothetical protein [Ruminococcus sp.]
MNPTIQYAKAIFAATIDEMLADYVMTRINWDCMRSVLVSHGLNIGVDVILGLADLEMSALDPIMAPEDIMYSLGVDAANITEWTLEYHNCCRGFVIYD